MRTITITTPDNIEIEYRLAGAGSRLAAVMVDFIVVFIMLIILVLFLGAPTGGWLGGGLLIAYFVVIFGYFIIAEQITKGQSVGKKLFGLRVIRENGLAVGLTQSVVRNLFRYFVDILGIGVICVFFSKKNKRIGDMVASTIVVLENPNALSYEDLAGPALVNTDNFYWPALLTKEEYALLKDYCHRRHQFEEFDYILRAGWVEYLNKKEAFLHEPLDEESFEIYLTGCYPEEENYESSSD